MLLTISTTHTPATDLGYLLHKHPAKLQTFSLSFGQAHVFYPEATEARCTAALLLDIDPIQLFRQRNFTGKSTFDLDFSKNQTRVCTIDEPLSTSVDLPAPLANWLIQIVRRLERQVQPAEDKLVDTNSENA